MLFRSVLDDAPSAVIKNYVYDGRSPRAFYVYPRPASTTNVEAHMAVVPADVTMDGVNGGSADSTISLDDVYQTAIYDFIVFRALSKNTDAKNDQEAVRSYQAFLNRLGLKLQADRAFDPHRNAPPATTAWIVSKFAPNRRSSVRHSRARARASGR